MPTYELITTPIDDKTTRYQIQVKEVLLSFAQVARAWQESEDFRAFYNQILVDNPSDAFFWENKAITDLDWDIPYEFVLVGTSAFVNKTAQPSPFRSFFDTQLACSFTNLRGDAQLVVPCPNNACQETYTHIANFVRKASPEQIDAFWKLVGEQFAQRVSNKPTWLSTSGLGVHWVHVRLDSRPKYYTYKPYKR